MSTESALESLLTHAEGPWTLFTSKVHVYVCETEKERERNSLCVSVCCNEKHNLLLGDLLQQPPVI